MSQEDFRRKFQRGHLVEMVEYGMRGLNTVNGYKGQEPKKKALPMSITRRFPNPQINTQDTLLAQLQIRSLKYPRGAHYGGR